VVTSRTTTSQAAGRLPPVLWAGVVVALVLGIVGMHTLNTHGLMGGTDHATMTTAPDSGRDMSGDMTATHGGVAGAPAATMDGSEGGTGDVLGHMLMLCVAMLTVAAGALLLALLALRRHPHLWAQLPTAPTTVTRWVSARLGVGPPPVWEFSVVRC
jgi:hypothetical protein